MAEPNQAIAILDREFLEIRTRLLDLAAALDRVDRADGTSHEDQRWTDIRRGLQLLVDSPGDRAAAMQLLFSLPYDDAWRANLGVPRSS